VQDVLDGLFQIGVINSALIPASLVYAGMNASGQGIGLATGTALLVYALLHGVLLFFDGWLQQERVDAKLGRGSNRLVLYELLPLPFIYIVATSFQPAGLGSLILLGGMAVICAVILNRLDTTHKKLIKSTGDLALKEETNRILGSIITAQKREVEANDMITTTLVHDLRSPASAVLGALDVLAEFHQKDQGEEDDLADQAMKVARHSTQRLLNLIDSMMDSARSQAGRLDLSLGEVDLRKLAGTVLSEFMPQAREYGIMLQNEITEATPTVRADQNKILRVLSNLVDNAIKFTPAGGQVVLSAEPAAQEMLAIHVRDTGPGIPEAYREIIFDRFSQVPGSYGRQRGSGLGLTFCRLAVEANGGKIWVDQNPGGGSCFTFTLPLAARS